MSDSNNNDNTDGSLLHKLLGEIEQDRDRLKLQAHLLKAEQQYVE